MRTVIVALCAAILTWALTGLLLRVLSSGAHLAQPNERSMHARPIPVGAGLAIVASIVILVPLWQWPLTHDTAVILGAAALLSLISAVDHYRPLWPLTRLIVQAVAVAVPLALLPETARLAPDAFPLWLERLGLGLAWLWLINLTNFMDGIDGIAGAEGAAIALGVVAVTVVHVSDTETSEIVVALALAGACLGYLVWNWSPARIFMGDAGSIPIGYLAGWLLLSLALKGAWAAALVLPLLFVTDATLTLARRVLSGHKPWQAHRTHFYQRAVQGGASPVAVVLLLTACNAVLILAAVQPPRQPVAILSAGGVVAAFFLMFLSQWARQSMPPQPSAKKDVTSPR